LLRAPERFAAFLERIDAADPEILQHRRIERKQGAALAVDRVAMAQPVERATKPGTKVSIAVDETIQKAGRTLDRAIRKGWRHHGDFSKLNRADKKAGEGRGDCQGGMPKLASPLLSKKNKRLMYRFGRRIAAGLLLLGNEM
jgi:hypothetical protein